MPGRTAMELIFGYGLCECGCGEETRIAKASDLRYGTVAGEPVRFVNGHQRRKISPAYEEQDRGYETPCRIWLRAFNHAGYGVINRDGRQRNAHRVYYEDAFGEIPQGLAVDHLCRVRACVNPDHLEAVTNAENVRRGAKARFSWPEIETMRVEAAHGASLRTLAVRFGTSKGYISEVVNGKRWALCEPPETDL